MRKSAMPGVYPYGRMPIMKVRSEPLTITSSDSSLEKLRFKPYRSKVERRVVPFFPGPNEPQTMEIKTPWGAELTARKGDFLISEVETPNDYWPINPVIFEESYVIIRPGYCIKKAITLLVPLTEITHDPEREVTVVSLEEPETVRPVISILQKGSEGRSGRIQKKRSMMS